LKTSQQQVYDPPPDDHVELQDPHPQDPHHEVVPDLSALPELPPATITPEEGVTGLRCSNRERKKPTRLVPSFGSKSYQSTVATTVQLVHPDEHLDQHYVLVAHYIMTQYSMKAGMKKKFKERGEEAVTKELSQLHYRDTFEPLHSRDLNKQERDEVLESHLFLKEKETNLSRVQWLPEATNNAAL
jgi:hypothetical protein